jgi:hypothetical protein
VIVDGNTLSIHIIDPKDEKSQAEDKQKASNSTPRTVSTEKDQKDQIANYTCFTGVFNDGFVLSYSSQPIKLTSGVFSCRLL